MRVKVNKELIDKIFFTSDTHFQHENIIKYCNRPFDNMYHMNDILIENWNKIVPKDGIVFHLGDFAMTANLKWIESLVHKLNGQIHLILGNHDYQNRFDREYVKKIFHDKIYDVVTLTIFDDEIEGGHANLFLSHYPHMFWQRGSYHLHGHVHSGPKSTASEIVPYHNMRYDVGVDNNNFNPISYNNLKIMFTKRLLK